MIQSIVGREFHGSLKDCLLDFSVKLDGKTAMKCIKKGCVRVNGIGIKKDVEMEPGDIIDFYIPTELSWLIPAPSILYEDLNFIVYHKPQGLLSDSKKEGEETLLRIAIQHMRETGEYDPYTLTVPFLCYGLDQYTGGLVLVAKNESMFLAMETALRERRVHRFYLARTVGSPKEKAGELFDYIVRQKYQCKVQKEPGKQAEPIVTRYRVKKDGLFPLVEAELVTMKPQQVRAHLAWAGMPVLGDSLYGEKQINRRQAIPYEALWQYKIRFDTGKNNLLEYLDGQTFETDDLALPYVSE